MSKGKKETLQRIKDLTKRNEVLAQENTRQEGEIMSVQRLTSQMSKRSYMQENKQYEKEIDQEKLHFGQNIGEPIDVMVNLLRWFKG